MCLELAGAQPSAVSACGNVRAPWLWQVYVQRNGESTPQIWFDVASTMAWAKDPGAFEVADGKGIYGRTSRRPHAGHRGACAS